VDTDQKVVLIVRQTRGMSEGKREGSLDDLRVQQVGHRDGRRSYIIRDVANGAVHARADRYLASFDEGTQRTYAYHLVDHLRWLASTGYAEDTVRFEDLRR